MTTKTIIVNTHTAPKKPIFIKTDKSFFMLMTVSLKNSKRAIHEADRVLKL